MHRPSRPRARPLALGACLAGALCLALACGCFGVGAPLERVVDEGPAGDDGSTTSTTAASGATTGGETVEDPHAASGIDPPHGAFTGGLRAVVRGSGFRSGMRVWVGEAEAGDVVVLGPTRVQIVTPPGAPGAADVTTEVSGDASTRRTLEDGYIYDAFYLEPAHGPTSGGVITRIVGEGTAWSDATEVRIDGKPCTSLDVEGPHELRCEVPAGTLGSKPVRIGAGDDATTVLDAFTYDDDPDGSVGGLDGDPLDGTLEVRVLGSFTGEPIPGAFVVLGPDLDGVVELTGEDGRVVAEDPSLTSPVTVTVAMLCHQPITFVDVAVNRVTVYLDPILDVACITDLELPPPGGGGGGTTRGTVRGEIHWDPVGEFDRGPFDVPLPGPDERIAAYVFTTAAPGSNFSLPPAMEAITPESDGSIGYEFEIVATPGNRVLYALAGLEDRSSSPPRFVPWSMGVLRGVVVHPGATTEDVAIHMRFPLEHALSIELEPPAPTPRGPDRLLVTTSIRVGTEGSLSLPQGKAPRALPLQGPVDFVGLPLLDGPLEGATYAVSARAGTGADLILPVSVVADVATSVAGPVSPGPFVGVPTLTTPAPGEVWDGNSLAFDIGEASATVDVVVLDVATANDVVHWRIVAPGDRRQVVVPGLRDLPVGLPPFGSLSIALAVGRIDGLSWDQLQYRHLRTQNMDAYAVDEFDAYW